MNRASESGADAIDLLTNVAAPKIAELMDVLSGKLQADGTRDAAGMIPVQLAKMKRDSTDANAAVDMLDLVLWVLLGVGGPGTVAVVMLSSRAIVRPIVAMTGAMKMLAGGDKTVEIPFTARHDETGEMAKAVLVFKENMIRADTLAAAQQQEQEAR